MLVCAWDACLRGIKPFIIQQVNNSAAAAGWPPISFMAIRHYLTFADFTLDQYTYLFERTKLIKRKFKNYETYHPLLDRTLVVFPSQQSTPTFRSWILQ